MYYQPSGNYNTEGLIITPLFIIIGAAIGSVAYVLAVWYIPFVYLSFVFTIFFGVLVGYVTAQGIALGKIRNFPLALAFAILAALLAEYMQWAVYVSLLVNSGDVTQYLNKLNITETNISPLHMLETFFSPGAMLTMIKFLYTEGVWSINEETYKEGSVLTIWILEALMLGVFTTVMVVMQVEKPFSESQNVWLHPYLLNQRLPPLHQKTSHIANLESGDFTGLLALEPIHSEQESHTRMEMLTDGQSESYIRLYRVDYEIEDGKKTMNRTELYLYLRIPEAIRYKLEKKFHK